MGVIHRLIDGVRTQAAEGCLAVEPESFVPDLLSLLALSAFAPESDPVPESEPLADSLDEPSDPSEPFAPLLPEPLPDGVADARLSVR